MEGSVMDLKLILALGLVCFYLPRLNPSVVRRVQVNGLKNRFILALEILALTGVGLQLYYTEARIGLVAGIGLSMFLLGVLFSTVARFQLRSNYMPALSAQTPSKIVTGGVYRIVRHPVYLGTILVAIGFELTLQPALSLVALFSVPILANLAEKEECVMQSFGSAHTEFCKRTPYRLIPFVW